AGPLPFVLRTDVDLDREPWLAAEETWAPVLVETAVAAPDAPAFAARAAGLVRERVYGALAAHVLAPPRVLRRGRAATAGLIAQLRHGTVAVNTWAAVAYAAISPPWGAAAGADAGTGRGTVHGSQALRAPRRTLLTGPFRPWPRPPWLPHRRAIPLLEALTE